MTDDLLWRLRHFGHALCDKAADTIASLTAERDRLQEDYALLLGNRDGLLDRLAASRKEVEGLQARVEELRRLADAVCWFDWSDNDSDAVAAINALRAALASPGQQEGQNV